MKQEDLFKIKCRSQGRQKEKRNFWWEREKGRESGCLWKHTDTLTSKIHAAWEVIREL